MKKFLITITVIFPLTFIAAQTKATKETVTKEITKNQFRFSLGLGYEDGLIFLGHNPIPTFGMSYERRLSRRFGWATHLLLYYRSFADYYVIGSTFPAYAKFRGSFSPSMTQADKDKLANSGIVQLRSEESIKLLSVPIDMGFTFYPLSTKHHKAGIYLGFGLTYESHNWYQDYIPGIMTLSDGSKIDITLNVPTEYRNFSPGFSTKFMYEYSFKDYAIGARCGNSNIIMNDLFAGANEPVWETSIYWAFKF